MSGAAEVPELPAAWERLEHSVEDAVAALDAWRRRARLAEAEVERLRRALEEAAAAIEPAGDVREQLRRLRAENAALGSRMAQAHRRVDALRAWADAIEKST